MTGQSHPGGTFALPNAGPTLNRLGYGAMQLAGEGVWGPPDDEDAAVAVLRAAVEAGVNHIDTADFYGPHVTNRLIRRALHPYPDDLTIVTKVGFLRGRDKSWNPAHSPAELAGAVHANLENLGLDAMEVVNLRVGGVGKDGGPNTDSIETPFAAMLDLQRQGLVRHIGLSNASPEQVAEARAMGQVACVQNLYNLAHRDDDAFVDDLARDGIAYVPFFPLGGFSPLQSDKLSAVADALGASKLQVALAWLLRRSPNVLLIPGTSSVEHLRENLKAAALELPAGAMEQLDKVGSEA